MPIEAVIFDWGGTLTRWHDIDFHAESLALAEAVANAHHEIEVSRKGSSTPPATRSGAGGATTSRAPPSRTSSPRLWPRPRPGGAATASATSGSRMATPTRRCGRPGRRSARDGIKIGVLSNTPGRGPGTKRSSLGTGCGTCRRRRLHQRDPVDQAAPRAFGAAMSAVGATDPGRCVFVGDRPFDDIYGAPAGSGRTAAAQRDPACPTWTYRGRAGRRRPVPRRAARDPVRSWR